MTTFRSDPVLRLVRMLSEFEDTALADCGFELDVCTLIAEYEVDTRGPEMLRDKIFKMEDNCNHLAYALIYLRLYQDSPWTSEVPRDEIHQYLNAPTTDGSRVFGLHAGRADQSFNIKMILVSFPIKHTESGTCSAFIWEETIQSFWNMFVNNKNTSYMIDVDHGQQIIYHDLVDKLSNTSQGQRIMYSLVADDAAELARFRMAAGRIKMRQCDMPSIATTTSIMSMSETSDDVDMFITRDALDHKNESRLEKIRELFPDGVTHILAEYATDQTHVASEMITLATAIPGPGVLKYITIPDPENSTIHWSMIINKYRPINMICRGMRNNPYCDWMPVRINTCDFISDYELHGLTQSIIEARTMCIDPNIFPNLIQFNPNLITEIIDRLRDGVRFVVNQKMNRDMRQIKSLAE